MKLCIVALFILTGTMTGFSQSIGMNSTASPPDPSAGLDVSFTNLGLLFPRVALANSTSFSPLSAHVAGMMVYNTAAASDVTPGFYIDNGTRWLPCEAEGYSPGDMQYWNGSIWSVVPVGQPGQTLQLSSINVPLWVGGGYPSLVSTTVGLITATTASSGGNIIADGGFAVIARGVCWSTAPNPTIALATKTADGAGTGAYVSSLTGLTTQTTYFVRAYATNSIGTTYGNQYRFVTP